MMKVVDGRTGEEFPRTGDVWHVAEFDSVRLQHDVNIQEAKFDNPKYSFSRDREENLSFRPPHIGDYRVQWKADDGAGELTIRAVSSILGDNLFDILRREVCELAVDLQSAAIGRCWIRMGDLAGRGTGARVKESDNPAPYDFAQWTELFERAWKSIERAPCTMLRSKAMPIKADQARSSKARMRAVLNPNLRYVEDIGRTPSVDTPENRWLAIALDTAITVARSQIRILKSEPLLSDEDKSSATIDEELATGERCINTLNAIRNTGFFANLQKGGRLPNPTKKLMSRPGYAEAYRLLHDLASSATLIHELIRLESLRTVATSGGVRKSSEIYEIWCFLKLYHSLRTKLRFGYIGVQPQTSLRISDSTLELARSEYLLIRDFAGKQIGIRLRFDVPDPLTNLRPDILMKVKSPIRKLGGGTLTVSLDAKYHDFTKCGGKTLRGPHSFREDIEGVALEKYIRRLGSNVSYILHPCSGFEYKGEIAYSDYIGRDVGGVPDDEVLNYPGHRIGALNFRPDGNGDVERLLTLIFVYHLGLTSLCIHCGAELVREDQYFVNPSSSQVDWANTRKDVGYGWDPTDPTTSFVARCDCQRWWRVSFCSGNGKAKHDRKPEKRNRLITHGSSEQYIGIHEYVDRTARCPACLDLLSAGDPCRDEFDPSVESTGSK